MGLLNVGVDIGPDGKMQILQNFIQAAGTVGSANRGQSKKGD